MMACMKTALSAKEIITQKVVLVMAQLLSIDLVMKRVSGSALTMAARLVYCSVMVMVMMLVWWSTWAIA